MAIGRSMDMTRRTALYRFYDAADVLLYVGIAFTPRTRWYGHASEKSWWPEVVRREVCWYANRRDAQAAERVAIRTEGPRYNIVGVDKPVKVPRKPRRKPHRAPAALLLELKRIGQAHGRAKRKREQTADRLGETIRRAAAEGIGPAEITRLIDHQLTERTVFRIIENKP